MESEKSVTGSERQRLGQLLGLLVSRMLFLAASVGALVACLWPGFPVPEIAAALAVIFFAAYIYLRWSTRKMLGSRRVGEKDRARPPAGSGTP
jgi:protein-S-isoprenylcysteine O-methyltransferase Ste14